MIHLVTDTTAYLPPEIAKKLKIRAVPLKVTIGDTGIDENQIALEDFYTRLAQVETTPRTSQPSPGEFMVLYEELTRGGDEVLSVHISSGLSGTSLVAEMAAQQVAPDRITVVDSRSATCGLAMMVRVAAKALSAGASREDAAALVRQMTQRYTGVFLVETLDYLARGGRINGAARFLGTVLHLHPLLYMNDGKIDGLGLARTRKRGLQQVLDEVEKRVGQGPIYACVTHILCPEDAQALAEQIQGRFQCVDFFVNETGPAIGSHVGPGFIGFAACPVLLDDRSGV